MLETALLLRGAKNGTKNPFFPFFLYRAVHFVDFEA
jgi:hypothetical protein